MTHRHAMDEDSVTDMSLQRSEFSEEEHEFNPATEVHPQFISTTYERSLRVLLNDYNTSLSWDNFKFCLLGYILDDRSFTDADMQAYMAENWPMYTRILHYDRNFFIIKFASRADLLMVLDNGPYVVDGGLLILRRMYDDEDLALDSLQIDRLSVWVRMHGAAITSYNYRGARDLTKNLGDIAIIKEDCVNLKKATYIPAKRCLMVNDAVLFNYLDNHFMTRAIKNDSPMLIDAQRPLFSSAMRANGHKQKQSSRIMANKYLQIHHFYEHVPEHYIQDGFQIIEVDAPQPDAMYPAMFPEDDDEEDGHNDQDHEDNHTQDTTRRAAPTAQEPLSDESDSASSGTYHSVPLDSTNSIGPYYGLSSSSDSEMSESFQSGDVSAHSNIGAEFVVLSNLNFESVGDVPVSRNPIFDVIVSNSESVTSDSWPANLPTSVTILEEDVILPASDSSSFLRSLMYYSASEENNGLQTSESLSETFSYIPTTVTSATTLSVKRKGAWMMSAPELEFESDSDSTEEAHSYHIKVRNVVSDSEVAVALVRKNKRKKQKARRKSMGPSYSSISQPSSSNPQPPIDHPSPGGLAQEGPWRTTVEEEFQEPEKRLLCSRKRPLESQESGWINNKKVKYGIRDMTCVLQEREEEMLKCLALDIIIHDQNVIVTRICESSGLSWLAVFLYGLPSRQGRAEFWSNLTSNLSSFNYPIVLLEDFNQVVSQEDKCGGRLVRDQDTGPVRQFLMRNNLDKLQHIGCWYTWSNNRQQGERIYERLDRAFVNRQWLSVFPSASIRNLPIMVSDHAPILVQVKHKQKKTRPRLRFEQFWTNTLTFTDLVQSAWRNNNLQITNLQEKLSFKLKSSLIGLSNWSKDTFGNLDKLVTRLSDQLAILQSHWEEHTDDDTSFHLLSKKKEELEQAFQYQRDYWHQRSKLIWPIQGDKNTK
ncbi:OLC1v1024533C1 [Oldenlandia corymbosa var. corymbosa]|uniref:OLC1v1024533C1 n=1 Tax=Oldenlandia corymbosa var. corymbosa TaxID=529605 RepID=A0AAV1C2K1_OLDCO|nr:OLC1v1024533C1 [Oldenlandia corymbosa var. corymbosa]